MNTPILVLDPNSSVPPYEQIGAQIRLQIATGHLLTGAFLPSVRQLARDLGVAPNTVVRAYSELEREGWVITSARRGVLIASPSPSQVAKAQAQQFEQAVTHLLVTAHQLGVTPAQIHAEIDRRLNAFPHLGSRR
jgi:DNA-binding transcriptional regulator YhcF (GntR family)